jgi:hypothetical protein
MVVIKQRQGVEVFRMCFSAFYMGFPNFLIFLARAALNASQVKIKLLGTVAFVIGLISGTLLYYRIILIPSRLCRITGDCGSISDPPGAQRLALLCAGSFAMISIWYVFWWNSRSIPKYEIYAEDTSGGQLHMDSSE